LHRDGVIGQKTRVEIRHDLAAMGGVDRRDERRFRRNERGWYERRIEKRRRSELLRRRGQGKPRDNLRAQQETHRIGSIPLPGSRPLVVKIKHELCSCATKADRQINFPAQPTWYMHAWWPAVFRQHRADRVLWLTKFLGPHRRRDQARVLARQWQARHATMPTTGPSSRSPLREKAMKQRSMRSPVAWGRHSAVPLCALLFALVMHGAAGAAALVDTIVVKYRDDVLPQNAAEIPSSDRLTLGHLLRAGFTDAGRTKDGAFRLAIQPPLTIDEARAAINRVRLNPDVLYVNIAERNPLPKTLAAAYAGGIERPVRGVIVKYKDPALVANAAADRLLPAAQLQRVATLAGMPMAHQRTMSGGEYLLRFFTPMSAIGAFEIARRLEEEADVEYADPDLWKWPTLAPNDTCFAANTSPACFNAAVPGSYMHEWHLMPSASEVGGANLPPAWDINTGSSSIFVGVVDTGSLPNHPDLAGRFGIGYDFIYDFAVANDSQPVQSAPCLQGGDPTLFDPLSPPCVSSRDADPSDPGDWIDSADQNGNPFSWFAGCPGGSSSWHGSHTSGTIGALSNNAAGIAGINWVSKVVPLRVLGKCGGYTSDIVDAITWGSGGTVSGVPANTNAARVLNLSLGGSGPCASSEQAAINGALGRGTVVVISAGNTNTDAINNAPGNCNGNITVAATQRQGIKASYSAYGTSVEIAAPGGGRNYPTSPSVLNLVVSTLNNGATTPDPSGYIYAGYNGTSMAAPHVAGIASLMLSVNPTLTPAQVLSVMQTTARPFPVVAGATCPSASSCNCTTALCGAGLINAGAALATVLPPVGSGFAAGSTFVLSASNAVPTVVTSTAVVCPASGILVITGSGESAAKSSAAGTAFVGIAYSISRNSIASDNSNIVQSSALANFSGDVNRDFLNVQRFDLCTPGQTYNYYLTAYATTPQTSIVSGSFVFNGRLTASAGPANSSIAPGTTYVTSATNAVPTIVTSLAVMCPASGVLAVSGSGESAAKSSSAGNAFIGLAYSIARNSAATDNGNVVQSSALAVFNGDVNRDFLNVQRVDSCTPGISYTYNLTAYATTAQTNIANASFVFNGRLTAVIVPVASSFAPGIKFVGSATNATPTIVTSLNIVCPASGKAIVTASGESAAKSISAGSAFIGLAYSIARGSTATDNSNVVQSSALAAFNGDANRDFLNVQRSDTCTPGQPYTYYLTVYATTPQTGITSSSFVWNGGLVAMLP
jgi:serine protease